MEGLSFSLDLQAKKFAYHSSIDAGRRYETPGSEIKDFYYGSNSSHGISIFISIFLGGPYASPNAQRVMFRRPVDTCPLVGCVTGEKNRT